MTPAQLLYLLFLHSQQIAARPSALTSPFTSIGIASTKTTEPNLSPSPHPLGKGNDIVKDHSSTTELEHKSDPHKTHHHASITSTGLNPTQSPNASSTTELEHKSNPHKTHHHASITSTGVDPTQSPNTSLTTQLTTQLTPLVSPLTTTPNISISFDTSAQVSAYLAGLSLAGSPTASAPGGNVTAATFRLFGFEGCKDLRDIHDAEAQIYSGWDQAQEVMALKALAYGQVDFNSAGALDYLGPAGLNSPRQGDMNNIFRNFATMTPVWWPKGFIIHARCDDPDQYCRRGPTDSAFMYTKNGNENEDGYTMINFCVRYFLAQTFDAFFHDARKSKPATKYNMNLYMNAQGAQWVYQLMHVNWVTLSDYWGPNEHVTDLWMQIRDSHGSSRYKRADDPMGAKILARFPDNPGDWVLRNAGSLSWFMVSQYVQTRLADSYPWYPLVNVTPIFGMPFDPAHRGDSFEDLFIYDRNGTVTLNATNPMAAEFGYANPTTFATDPNDPAPSPLVIKSFAPNSAYPSTYISSLSAWLASETWAPSGRLTIPPSAPTSTKTSQHTKTAVPPPVPTDICKDYYQTFNDWWTVFGKDFNNATLGPYGRGLLSKIRDCGIVTYWTFNWLENDPHGWQWNANGELPIDTRQCVGGAVAAVGGVVSSCWGSGM